MSASRPLTTAQKRGAKGAGAGARIFFSLFYFILFYFILFYFFKILGLRLVFQSALAKLQREREREREGGGTGG